MSYNLLKNLILYPLFFLLFLYPSGCGKEEAIYYTNPDRRAAEMIFNKRIVMIGESPHSHPAGFDGMIKILNEWLRQVLEDDSKPRKLTLILETDSADAIKIDRYFDTGVIDSILDPGMPLENYEFFANLRYFHQKIDSINKVSNSLIKFTVRGFEEIGANFKADYLLKPRRESELWFVNERDVYTSNGIIKYVKEHPEERILIFYGGSHLQEGKVNKNLGFHDLSDEECMGYYLIYYLRKEFGKENIVSIEQPIMYTSYFIGTPLEGVTDSNILVSHKNLELRLFRPEDYEYFIFRPVRISIPHPAGYCFSRVIIEKSINILKQYEQVLSGYKAKGVYYKIIDYIWIITGIYFNNAGELEKWYNENGYNGFERLNSKDFREQIFNSLFSKLEDNLRRSDNYRYLLSELGFSDRILDTNYGADSTIWREYTWPEEIDKVVFLNSIGIYWFGYPDEKVIAKEYLVKFSGEDFAEPEKYLQWYRMKYYGYKY